jgi:hypothetical protein
MSKRTRTRCGHRNPTTEKNRRSERQHRLKSPRLRARGPGEKPAPLFSVFTYTAPFKTPDRYVCDKCGASGVKLWREYQTIASLSDLLCANCTLERGKMKAGAFDAEGYREDETYGYKTDQAGWMCPAVPCVEGDTYWGYTSVPPEGVAWWRGLPTYLPSPSGPICNSPIPAGECPVCSTHER